jgi:hypothetical protein
LLLVAERNKLYLPRATCTVGIPEVGDTRLPKKSGANLPNTAAKRNRRSQQTLLTDKVRARAGVGVCVGLRGVASHHYPMTTDGLSLKFIQVSVPGRVLPASPKRLVVCTFRLAFIRVPGAGRTVAGR